MVSSPVEPGTIGAPYSALSLPATTAFWQPQCSGLRPSPKRLRGTEKICNTEPVNRYDLWPVVRKR
jgi:hypothetical protein